MNILVTGSKGFIGKNLIHYINDNYDFKVIEFSKNEDLRSLENKLMESDFIIHLAAVNRPKDKKLFHEINVNLTQYICDILIKNSLNIPIIFSSSTQYNLENDYGKSKLEAENILQRFSIQNKNPIFIFRLPGVFGKWARPNYNSVVSTFCHNIANGKEIIINDPNKKINLVYIDDVVKAFCDLLKKETNGFSYQKVDPEYKITLKDLADKIKRFSNQRKNLFIDQVAKGLNRKLYSTFISYINETDFDYNLPEHIDERGKFVEILKNEYSGQFAYFTANPGFTRGGHYHNTKTEKFIVISGEARFNFKNLVSGKNHEIFVKGSEPKVIDSIPGWIHNITNIGNDELKVILWSSEIFDKKNPDTYQK